MHILPIIVSILCLALVSFLAILALSGRRGKKQGELADDDFSHEKETQLKEAQQRLVGNPNDVFALNTLANTHFSMGNFKEAMRIYQLLLEKNRTDAKFDSEALNLRYGIAALQSGALSEAHEALILVQKKHPNNPEVNFGLGKIAFLHKQFSKAILFLKRTIEDSASQDDINEALKLLGQSYCKLKRRTEALPYLTRYCEAQPGDIDSLYALAQCKYASSQYDSAHEIFRSLIQSPKWKTKAALFSGNIFALKKEWKSAIADYEYALLAENLTSKLQIELKYRLAHALSQSNNISQALNLYHEINSIHPGYKDIAGLILRFQELNSNHNLRLYHLSPVNDFIALSKLLLHAIVPKARIDIADSTAQRNEYVDILAQVKTKNWEDLALFRFLRTEGLTGELFVREFYAHMKTIQAKRSYCISPGSFSAESINFTESRFIELIDKKQLLKLLQAVDTNQIVMHRS